MSTAGPPAAAFRVFRDPWGVPHVRADDELALAEGQGWVTAVDRGWQVEVDRWRAEGRLAERLGPAGLDWDRFARQVRLADTAQRAYAALVDEDRAWVDAYVRGVNRGLERGRDVPEVHALADLPGTLPAHEPWPAWAPLGVLLVAHVLFSGFPHLLWRDHVARTLGAAHPDRPVHEVVGLLAADGGPGSGSNAWALAGARTRSGLPLLAGDPHRLLELPGVYQQVRLACPAYDVLGLAFPGVPGVPHFGHAGEVAWGITNAMAHHLEVFRERLAHADDGVRALGRDGWEPVAHGVEVVRVRTADGVTEHEVPWVETPRGVVVTGLEGPAALEGSAALEGPAGLEGSAGPDDGPRTYAVRLPVRVTADVGVGAARALLHARSADDVARAVGRWVDPVNRVLTADRSGRVLNLTAGRVPVRAAADRVLPLDAWSDAAGGTGRWWSPAAPVPVDDVAVDANERPARDEVDLGHSYAPPHRARRLRALLATRPVWGPDDQAVLHGDTHLGSADALLAWLEPAAGAPAPSSAARSLLDRLRAWDHRMDAGSGDAALFAAWRGALVRRVAGHLALAPLHAPHGLGALLDPWFSVTARVADALPALLGAAWLGVDGRAEAVAALEEVALAAQDGEPHGVATTWGDVHRLVPLHVLLDVPGAPVPQVAAGPLSGDTDCVRCTASTPGVSDRCVRGSAARWVWDLADRDASRWGVPFGASGDPRSPHFADQTPTWQAAGTVAVVTAWERLEREETT